MSEYDTYVSECGRLSVRLPAGLDAISVAKLMTFAIEHQPAIIDLISSGSLMTIGFVAVPSVDRLNRYLRSDIL